MRILVGLTCLTLLEGAALMRHRMHRKAFDSVDEKFDDSVPAEKSLTKENFFTLLHAVFERNKRWSNIQPAPGLGDMKTAREEVEFFYNFWFDWDSWREFSYLDEEDKEKGEDRWERREMEKMNKVERERRRKDEMKRIRKLVEMAYAKDPRISQFKKDDKDKKERAKIEKQRAAKEKIEEEAKMKREEEERIKKVKEEEQKKANEEKEIEKAKKAEAKKALSEQRKRLRAMAEGNKYWTGIDIGEEAATNLYPAGTVERWSVVADYVNEHRKDKTGRPKKEKEVIQQAKLVQALGLKAVENITEAAATVPMPDACWTPEEQKSLELALKSNPATDAERWTKISEAVGRNQSNMCKETRLTLISIPTGWENLLALVEYFGTLVFVAVLCGGFLLFSLLVVISWCTQCCSYNVEKKNVKAAKRKAILRLLNSFGRIGGSIAACYEGWNEIDDAFTIRSRKNIAVVTREPEMHVIVPEEFTRAGNLKHTGEPSPIADGHRFEYGTAGFRVHSDYMGFVAYRIGYLASLRARTTGKAIGVMITASHNPEHDNGVKIIDSKGEMLAADWENHATQLVNVSDKEFPKTVRELEYKLNTPPLGSPSSIVVCGRDTRASGPWLRKAVREGVRLFRGAFEDFGLLTTPQLHYIVYVKNHPSWGPEGEAGYYNHHASAFKDLYKKMQSRETSQYFKKLHLGCANGIGAPQMRQLAEKLPTGALSIDFLNEVGPLNHECGADYVKISRTAPVCFENVPLNERCAVFDGDADRLVYFYKKDDKSIELLDGDKIAVLFAKYYKDLLADENMLEKVTLAIVQTAYANGNSTKYMKEQLGITPIFVPTGVKHLHQEAAKYDCAIYFEANGHGTATFSENFFDMLESSKSENASRLRLMSRLINMIVGDAMSDLLAVELILRHYNWTVQDWAAMYEDTPSKQLKIPVAERSRFRTTADETRLVEPAQLQTQIDVLVEKRAGKNARAFVRPSVTENIVRVYAESASQDDADLLAKEIANAIATLPK